MSRIIATLFAPSRDWDALWNHIRTRHLGRLTPADIRRGVVLGVVFSRIHRRGQA